MPGQAAAVAIFAAIAAAVYLPPMYSLGVVHGLSFWFAGMLLSSSLLLLPLLSLLSLLRLVSLVSVSFQYAVLPLGCRCVYPAALMVATRLGAAVQMHAVRLLRAVAVDGAGASASPVRICGPADEAREPPRRAVRQTRGHSLASLVTGDAAALSAGGTAQDTLGLLCAETVPSAPECVGAGTEVVAVGKLLLPLLLPSPVLAVASRWKTLRMGGPSTSLSADKSEVHGGFESTRLVSSCPDAAAAAASAGTSAAAVVAAEAAAVEPLSES